LLNLHRHNGNGWFSWTGVVLRQRLGRLRVRPGGIRRCVTRWILTGVRLAPLLRRIAGVWLGVSAVTRCHRDWLQLLWLLLDWWFGFGRSSTTTD
jgi:hypothetical protein